jgi:hypothetical protein
MRGGLGIMRDAGDYWCVQGFGDLPASVRLAFTYHNQTKMSPVDRSQARVVAKRRQVNPGTHDRPEGGAEHDRGERTALDEGRRWSERPNATAVDDHVDLYIGQPIQGLGEVFPDCAEMHGTPGLGEAREEEPATVLLRRGEWERLIENRLPQRAPVAMGLCDAQQAFAIRGPTRKITRQDGLMGSRIAINKEDWARPGEREPNSQGDDAR